MTITIEPVSDRLTPSFHDCLDSVARERVYIEMVEAPPFREVREYQILLAANQWPAYYAVDGDRVVGWADIAPKLNPRLSHRGFLGMGVRRSHRGRGLATRLLQAAVAHARHRGLEKVELSVFTENAPAIALYRKLGFVDEGLIKKYRKLDGRDFDCLLMALDLSRD